MALRMTRSRVASENAVPHKTVDGPAVPGLRPRTALGEIQNGRRAANPTRNVQRKKAVTVATVPLPETVKPVQVQPTVPERKALSPMETHGCESSNLCQAFSDVLLDIKDVDADDCDNSVLCSEYVKEIYKYMRHLETAQAIRPSFLQGQEVTGKMRALLVNWLAEVTMSFQLLKETMFMAVAVIDRFLQDQPVTKTKLQLVGVTALFLAAKYEEIHPPAIDDFVYVTDFTYTIAEIREMERRILTVLGFSLGRPLPIQFLRRASKIAEVTAEQHTVAKYLLELCMVDYDMAHLPPSQVASAALALVLKIFGCSDWDKTLSHYMDYTEEALLPVMQHIAGNVVTIDEGQTKLTAIKKKYSSRRMMEIANIPQLKSAYIKNLAAVLKSQ